MHPARHDHLPPSMSSSFSSSYSSRSTLVTVSPEMPMSHSATLPSVPHQRVKRKPVNAEGNASFLGSLDSESTTPSTFQSMNHRQQQLTETSPAIHSRELSNEGSWKKSNQKSSRKGLGKLFKKLGNKGAEEDLYSVQDLQPQIRPVTGTSMSDSGRSVHSSSSRNPHNIPLAPPPPQVAPSPSIELGPRTYLKPEPHLGFQQSDMLLSSIPVELLSRPSSPVPQATRAIHNPANDTSQNRGFRDTVPHSTAPQYTTSSTHAQHHIHSSVQSKEKFSHDPSTHPVPAYQSSRQTLSQEPSASHTSQPDSEDEETVNDAHQYSRWSNASTGKSSMSYSLYSTFGPESRDTSEITLNQESNNSLQELIVEKARSTGSVASQKIKGKKPTNDGEETATPAAETKTHGDNKAEARLERPTEVQSKTEHKTQAEVKRVPAPQETKPMSTSVAASRQIPKPAVDPKAKPPTLDLAQIVANNVQRRTPARVISTPEEPAQKIPGAYANSPVTKQESVESFNTVQSKVSTDSSDDDDGNDSDDDDDVFVDADGFSQDDIEREKMSKRLSKRLSGGHFGSAGGLLLSISAPSVPTLPGGHGIRRGQQSERFAQTLLNWQKQSEIAQSKPPRAVGTLKRPDTTSSPVKKTVNVQAQPPAPKYAPPPPPEPVTPQPLKSSKSSLSSPSLKPSQASQATQPSQLPRPVQRTRSVQRTQLVQPAQPAQRTQPVQAGQAPTVENAKTTASELPAQTPPPPRPPRRKRSIKADDDDELPLINLKNKPNTESPSEDPSAKKTSLESSPSQAQPTVSLSLPEIRLEQDAPKVEEPSPPSATEKAKETAQRLWDEDESIVARERIAEWLGQREPFHTEALMHYMEHFEFKNMRLDDAFRKLCSKLYFKAEAQQIDRILEAFARRYWNCNPRSIFGNSDVVYAVVYSILLLNTDLHVAQGNYARMTRQAFVKNTMSTVRDQQKDRETQSGNGNGALFSKSWETELETYLKDVYISVKHNQVLQPLSSQQQQQQQQHQLGVGSLAFEKRSSMLGGRRVVEFKRSMSTIIRKSQRESAFFDEPQPRPSTSATATPVSSPRRESFSSVNSATSLGSGQKHPITSSNALSPHQPMMQFLNNHSADLFASRPPYFKEGVVVRKHLLETANNKAKHREWKECFLVVGHGELKMFALQGSGGEERRSMLRSSSAGAFSALAESLSGGHAGSRSINGGSHQGNYWSSNMQLLGSIKLSHSLANMLPPPGYNRQRPHVLAIQQSDGGVYLFQADSHEQATEWVETCNYWAARQSKEPLPGGVSNMEYGWGSCLDDVILNHDAESGQHLGDPDSVVIYDWSPPAPPAVPSTLDEKEQYEALQKHLHTLSEEMNQHRELKRKILVKFTSKCQNHAKVILNWEAKSNYMLHEIIKYQHYCDALEKSVKLREQLNEQKELEMNGSNKIAMEPDSINTNENKDSVSKHAELDLDIDFVLEIGKELKYFL